MAVLFDPDKAYRLAVAAITDYESPRPDIATLSHDEQLRVLDAFQAVIDGTCVSDHMEIDHYSADGFFNGHKEYLERMGPDSLFEYISGGHIMPRWNPADPLPEVFRTIKVTNDVLEEFSGITPDRAAGDYAASGWVRDDGTVLGAIENYNLQSPVPENLLGSDLARFADEEQLYFDGIGDWHSKVHIDMGGVMRPSSTAPTSPAFWMMHAAVDDVHDRWLAGKEAAMTYIASEIHDPDRGGKEELVALLQSGSQMDWNHNTQSDDPSAAVRQVLEEAVEASGIPETDRVSLLKAFEGRAGELAARVSDKNITTISPEVAIALEAKNIPYASIQRFNDHLADNSFKYERRLWRSDRKNTQVRDADVPSMFSNSDLEEALKSLDLEGLRSTLREGLGAGAVNVTPPSTNSSLWDDSESALTGGISIDFETFVKSLLKENEATTGTQKTETDIDPTRLMELKPIEERGSTSDAGSLGRNL